MKKVNYSFGGGSGPIMVSMRTRKMYFLYKVEDREELHRLYGGKQYYSSRSGASGAGYFVPEENDLLEIPGGYRANITHLSEAWPTEMFGVKGMVPVEGISHNSPAVIVKDGKLVFLNHSWQFIEALLGTSFKEEDHSHQVNYKYLNDFGKVSEFQIPWIGKRAYETRGNRPSGLSYSFEEYVSAMGVLSIQNLNPAKFAEEENSFLLSKMYLAKTEVGLARVGHFGLPVELIEGELFPQDNSRTLSSGWVTQGFGPYKFGYKRVAQGNKVYAVVEAAPGEINQKYSLLGEKTIEYEFVCENVLEWFSKPVTEWAEEMKIELLKKIRSEFLNSARWDESKQIAKVRELLQKYPETMFIIQDSLDTGNCRPGTQSFMDKYGITEPISAQSLIEHKKFNEMLNNSRFRVVVINKLFDV